LHPSFGQSYWSSARSRIPQFNMKAVDGHEVMKDNPSRRRIGPHTVTSRKVLTCPRFGPGDHDSGFGFQIERELECHLLKPPARFSLLKMVQMLAQTVGNFLETRRVTGELMKPLESRSTSRCLFRRVKDNSTTSVRLSESDNFY